MPSTQKLQSPVLAKAIRSFSDELIVFNKKNIETWNQEQSSNATQIFIYKSDINSHQYDIDRQKPRLDELNEKIRPLDSRISTLESSIYDLGIHQYREEITYQGEQRLVRRIENYEITNQIRQLENEKREVKRQRSPLANERDNIHSEINKLESKISKARNKIEKLEERNAVLGTRIKEGNNFLDKLENSPGDFFEAFKKKLESMLDKFEDDNPANQRDLVRICILEMVRNIKKIDAAVKDENQDEKIFYRNKFHQLCGLLSGVLSKLESEGHDLDIYFTNVVISALCESHIPLNGDLPDDHTLNITSQEHYNLNKMTVTAEEFEKYEKEKYEKNYNGFNERLDKMNPIYDFGKRIASRFDKQRAQNEFDIKFATTILSAANDMLDHPEDEVKANKFRRLAEFDVKGRPSLAKKIGGGLLIAFGIMVVIGSTFAIAASFGASTPLSLLGIALATTMLVQGASIASCAAGVTAVSAGAGLFAHGVRKGLSKEIVKLAEAVKNNQPKNS